MNLLAVLLAFGASHLFKNPGDWRGFAWFKSLSAWFQSHIELESQRLLVLIIVAAPIAALMILISLISANHEGLYVLISALVLFYTIGPESLEFAVHQNTVRKDLGLRSNASTASVIKRMADAALHRWFGVLFWFVLLGPAGALLYRLTERLVKLTDSAELQPAAAHVLRVLDYPVAWLMALALAIASDFERVYLRCKPYMNSESVSRLDSDFIYEATDFAVENCELPEDGAADVEESAVENVTLNVLKRMLMVCIVFIAVLVIFAFLE